MILPATNYLTFYSWLPWWDCTLAGSGALLCLQEDVSLCLCDSLSLSVFISLSPHSFSMSLSLFSPSPSIYILCIAPSLSLSLAFCLSLVCCLYLSLFLFLFLSLSISLPLSLSLPIYLCIFPTQSLSFTCYLSLYLSPIRFLCRLQCCQEISTTHNALHYSSSADFSFSFEMVHFMWRPLPLCL